ncbi:peptidoglycan-binding protein [Stagnimonas aquatica]|uniref:Peptidoglycan-binding protein n=1 Tax=Stagnimonas aquatica TaxID=2689987 RepID=A0A3N0VM20_9GAMM|nr:peptidoglycan-binding domain-containing protein [Stagnimonas aquatica]ROH93784.1 peptidoglycan-binding protein [Stagnimonas aquatica]
MRTASFAAFILAAVSTVAAASPYILEAERMLEQLGYQPGKVDGEFDAELTAAVSRFQADQRLPVTGLVDPQTHEVLMAAVAPPSGSQALPTAPVKASTPSGIIGGSGTAPQRRFGVLLEGALEWGGETVATVGFTNGSTQDVDTGQGVTLAGGLYFRPVEAVDIRATAGYKLVTTKASNADITLTRYVLKLTADYLLPGGFRIGAGPVQHMNIKFDGDGIGPNLEFDNALGYVAQLGWKWLAVSYTGMKYQLKNSAQEIDANNVGATFTWEF